MSFPSEVSLFYRFSSAKSVPSQDSGAFGTRLPMLDTISSKQVGWGVVAAIVVVDKGEWNNRLGWHKFSPKHRQG